MKGSILQQVTGIGNYIFHAFLTSDNTGYSLPLSSNERHQKVREQSKQTFFPISTSKLQCRHLTSFVTMLRPV